jgi:hypothetical protein
MTERDAVTQPDGTQETLPRSLMERAVPMEHRILILERAMERAFGRTWMDLLKKEPTTDRDGTLG